MKNTLATTIFLFLALLINPLPQASPAVVTVATYFGGSLEDTIRDLATDSDGNIYVTGGTNSTDFPATLGDRTHNGSQDVFVAKFSPGGQLLWSTLIGGPNYDRAYAIEVNSTGVYIGGRAGPGFPTTSGVVQPRFGGDADVEAFYGLQDGFIARLTHGGQLMWASYFGGNDRGVFRDIAIDSAGNVYGALTGATLDDPRITPGAFQTERVGGPGGVIVKISSDGTRVICATYLDASNYDTGTPSIRVNDAGEVWVLGFTNSSDMPTSIGAYDRSYNGGGDLHLCKLSADGSTLLYGTYLGGSAVEYSETHGLALDAAGNAYIAATTKSINLPTTLRALDTTYNGEGGSGTGNNTNYDGDGFVVKFSSTGQLLASTYLGGSLGDGLEGIMVAPDGGVVVSGATYSTNYPTTPGAFRTTRAGAADLVLTVLANDLSRLIYSSYFGGSGIDYGRSSHADQFGFYIAGHIKSSNFPVVNAVQMNRAGLDDGVLVKIAAGVIPTPSPTPTPPPCSCPCPTPTPN